MFLYNYNIFINPFPNYGSIRIYEHTGTAQKRIDISTGATPYSNGQNQNNNGSGGTVGYFAFKEQINLNEQAQIVEGSNFADEINWSPDNYGSFGPITINAGAGADVGNFSPGQCRTRGGINFGSGNDTLNLSVGGINNNVFFSGGLGDFTDTIKFSMFSMGKGQFVSNSDGSKTYVERDTEGTYNKYRFTGWEKVEIPSTTKKGETQVFSFDEFVAAVNKAYKPK